MGKPRSTDKELVDRLLAALRAGNYIETACAYAGIGTTTYFRWLKEAEADDAPEHLRELRESVESARAQAIVRNVKLIQDAATNGTWQAAAWWLERSQPHMWGRNDKVRAELSGPDGKPIETTVTVKEMRDTVLAFVTEDDEDTDGSVTA